MGANMGSLNEVALENALSRYEEKMELIRDKEHRDTAISLHKE